MPLEIKSIATTERGSTATLIDTSLTRTRPRECPTLSHEGHLYVLDQVYGLLLTDENAKEISHSFPLFKGLKITLNEGYIYLLGKNCFTIIDPREAPNLKIKTVQNFKGIGLDMVLDNMFLYVICWPFYLHIFDVSYEDNPRFNSTVEFPEGSDIVFKSLAAYRKKRFVIKTDKPEQPAIINMNLADEQRQCKIGTVNDLG